jgi:hypothetical protein
MMGFTPLMLPSTHPCILFTVVVSSHHLRRRKLEPILKA